MWEKREVKSGGKNYVNTKIIPKKVKRMNGKKNLLGSGTMGIGRSGTLIMRENGGKRNEK